MPNILNRPTLILNRSWVAINIATVATVIKKVWIENAKIVDPNDYSLHSWEDWVKMRPQNGEAYIQCVGFRLKVPEVVSMIEYDKMPETSVSFSRKSLFTRDKYTCQYCHIQPGVKELTIDHVKPRSRGGTSTWENCVLACITCNRKKADKTLKESRMKLRRKPVKPIWRPTFHTGVVLDSWEKFVSEMYWNVPLV